MYKYTSPFFWSFYNMFFRRKKNIDFNDYDINIIVNDPNLLKQLSYQAARGDKIAARKMGIFYFLADDFHSADFWYKMAIYLGDFESYKFLAELQLYFINKNIPENFLSNAKPDLSLAIKAILKAVEFNVPNSYIIYARILMFQNNDNINNDILTIIKEAALVDKNDWARMIMMMASKDNNPIALIKSNIPDSIVFWLNNGDLGAMTSLLMAKFILHKIVEGDFLYYLKYAVNLDHPEALFLYGKYLIIDENKIFQGENYIRKAIKLNNADAAAFLADYKASLINDNNKNMLEVTMLYQDAAKMGHLGARTILAINGLADKSIGWDYIKCLNYIADAYNQRVPVAQSFVLNNKHLFNLT